MGKIITVFNNKGGVGKTTLVHNIGYIMANRGKKVLLVDADPKMNLTAAVTGISEFFSSVIGEDNVDAQILNKYPDLSDFFELAVQNKEGTLKFMPLRKTVFNNNGAIDLLLSNSLLEMEFFLSSLVVNKVNSLTCSTLFEIRRAIRELKDKYDYIFLDTPPIGSSMINAVLFFSSDYYMIPVKADFLSSQVIDGIANIIWNWKMYLLPWFRKLGMQDGFESPIFLGVVPQMIKKIGVGADKNAIHKHWNTIINVRTMNFLRDYLSLAAHLAEFSRNNHFVEYSDVGGMENLFKSLFPDSDPFIICECSYISDTIRDFAERAALPVVSLNNEICKEVGEDDLLQETLSACKAEYDYIAEGLLRLP